MTPAKTAKTIIEIADVAAATPSAVADKGNKKPSSSQRQWLLKGLKQIGGKLPLFLEDGRQIPERTVQICIEQGWVEPRFANPVKPAWQVCRLTEKGRRVLNQLQ